MSRQSAVWFAQPTFTEHSAVLPDLQKFNLADRARRVTRVTLNTRATRLLAALGASLLLGGATPALAQNAAGAADEALLQAREAARKGDLDRLDAAARRLQLLEPEHPLLAYPEYWALNIRLKRATDLAGEAPSDAAVRQFLRRNEGSVAGDLARRDWLLLLGKRRDFTNFDLEFPRFVLQDDPQIACYDLLSRHLTQGSDVLARARLALSQPRDLGDGCTLLGQTLAAERKLEAEQIWAWLRTAFDEGQQVAARRYAVLLPSAQVPALSVLDAIYDKPASWLARSGSTANRLNRELVALALVRMARSEPEQTAAIYQRDWAQRLPADLRAVVWAHLAAAGSRKALPQSTGWSRNSLDANHLSDETLAWQTRGALREHDWGLLRQLIEKMPASMRRTEGGDGTWLYWLGRAAQHEGRGEEASRLFQSISSQHHFYGQLALEELGGHIMPPLRPEAVPEAEIAIISKLPGLVRALRFYQAGMRAPGNLEWNFTVRSLSDAQLLAAAEWARRNAILDRAVNTADRTRHEHDFGVRFLMPFREQLQPKTEALGLDLAWVYGLIRQESRFITNARSHAGAAGLMQVMPATARYVARRIGLDLNRGQPHDDAETNLTLGTNYLNMVLRDLDLSPVLATAAYNAGPGRSRTWRSTLDRSVEGAIFAETIPFNETRDYVKKVMSNATYYAALIEGKPQSLKARLGSVAPRPGSALTSNLP